MKEINTDDVSMIAGDLYGDEALTPDQIFGSLYAMNLPPDVGVSVVHKGIVYGVTGFSECLKDTRDGVTLFAGPCAIEQRKFLTELIDHARKVRPHHRPYSVVSVWLHGEQCFVDGYKVLQMPEGYHVGFYVDMDLPEVEALRTEIFALRDKQEAQQAQQDKDDLINDIYAMFKRQGF